MLGHSVQILTGMDLGTPARSIRVRFDRARVRRRAGCRFLRLPALTPLRTQVRMLLVSRSPMSAEHIGVTLRFVARVLRAIGPPQADHLARSTPGGHAWADTFLD